MKINLVKNGIFPILKDENGEDIIGSLDTGFKVSGTIQGEGKLIGTPCLFIRTSGCNLRCSWVGSDGNGSPCDTPYSSHNPEKNMMEIDSIIKILNANRGNISHVVISGGEPTLQKELGELLMNLSIEGFHTTIETNGTIYDTKVSKYTNLFSISPKLSTSTPWAENLKNTGIEFSLKWAEKHEETRIKREVLQNYINDCYEFSYSEDNISLFPSGHDYSKKLRNKDFQLKFVVSTMDDIKEIEEIVSCLNGVYPSDICLMPEGILPDDLMNKSGWVAMEAIKRGWRFTPRLHSLMFGTKRGV